MEMEIYPFSEDIQLDFISTHTIFIFMSSVTVVLLSNLECGKKIRTNLFRVRPPAEKGEKTGWNLAVIISPKVFL